MSALTQFFARKLKKRAISRCNSRCPGSIRSFFRIGFVLKSLADFYKDIAHGQFDMKRAIDIGEGAVRHLDVGAVILKPSRVDFRCGARTVECSVR